MTKNADQQGKLFSYRRPFPVEQTTEIEPNGELRVITRWVADGLTVRPDGPLTLNGTIQVRGTEEDHMAAIAGWDQTNSGLYVQDQNTITFTTNSSTDSTNVIRLNEWLEEARGWQVGTGTAASTDVYLDNQTFYQPFTIDATSTTTNYHFGNVIIAEPWAGNMFLRSERSERYLRRMKLREQWQPDISKMLGHRPRALGRPADFTDAKQNEILALQLLRSLVGPEQFRRYLKGGFVATRGPSGLTYKVVRKHHNVIVLDQGEHIASLCVTMKDYTLPPTDAVVAKLLICECDEKDIWEKSNVRWASQQARSNPRVLAIGVQGRGYGWTQDLVFDNNQWAGNGRGQGLVAVA